MKHKIANLLRILATALESEHCQATDEDLKPLKRMIDESMDVYVGYKTLSEITNKPISTCRVDACRCRAKKTTDKVKVRLKDVLHETDSK